LIGGLRGEFFENEPRAPPEKCWERTAVNLCLHSCSVNSRDCRLQLIPLVTNNPAHKKAGQLASGSAGIPPALPETRRPAPGPVIYATWHRSAYRTQMMARLLPSAATVVAAPRPK
jgi:hypothetical protein